jgi:hypothetical protein
LSWRSSGPSWACCSCNGLGIALAFGLEGLGWGMAFLLHSKAYPQGLPFRLKTKETNL